MKLAALMAAVASIAMPGGDRVETFADPAVIESGGRYFGYATSDPLNSRDRDSSGTLRIRRIPFATSRDLRRWEYRGEALASMPSWAAPGAGAWAPDIQRVRGRYLLYFTVTDTALEPACTNDSAIGVAVADSPSGPFVPTGEPVVAPRRAGPGCDFFWTFDPAMTRDADGSRVLYYGSYYGGVEARRLSADGLRSEPSTARRITTGDRYEGSYVIRRGGYWYFMGSSTDCCRGPLTGYSVFAGRAKSPFGPFRDRLGARLDEPRVGGTPVVTPTGDRWVGTGHNAVIGDTILYHAIDRFDPYLAAPNPLSIHKRPMLVDRLEWKDGWPSVRRGPDDRAGRVTDADEFSRRLDRRWSWVRSPAARVRDGRLRFPTQAGDLSEDSNSASVLTRPAPSGDFTVETKVSIDLPEAGDLTYPQAALLLYAGDDAFLKLAHAAIHETRQTEWAKEVPEPATPAGQRYGNTVVGPPGRTTWLRIARRGERYTAYTSRDGREWVRGGTWTHDLRRLRIGLAALGGEGYTAEFDYVRVYR